MASSDEANINISSNINAIQQSSHNQQDAMKILTNNLIEIIQKFNNRLSSLENAVKSCEYLLNEQQSVTANLNQQIQSIRNNISNTKPANISKDTNQPQSPLIATIDETQYEHKEQNNHNNKKNEYELQEMELDADQSDDLLDIGLQSASLESDKTQDNYRTLSKRFPSSSPQPLQSIHQQSTTNHNISHAISAEPHSSPSSVTISSTLAHNNRMMPLLEPGVCVVFSYSAYFTLSGFRLDIHFGFLLLDRSSRSNRYQ